MVNTQLFKTLKAALLPATNAFNAQQAPAYAYGPRHRLAQLAVTGCLNNTFYASASAQLDDALALALTEDPVFVARTAIYARECGAMKDMPALLLAVLAVRDLQLMAQVFPRVVDSGKMLRNVVQILRSGVVGRRSLGTRPKKQVQQWLLQASEKQLLHAAVGNAPSLADVVKMVHPKPADAWRAAWFAWLIGKTVEVSVLPPLTQSFERFKRAVALGEEVNEVPDVPFQMLTALPLTPMQWAQVARKGSWQMVRQNLNTFARHGVFGIEGMAEEVARKLRDPVAVAKARVLPYQLMSASLAADEGVPRVVQDALQEAMELSLANVPALEGRVVVCPDVSGSMSTPVTGHRAGATTRVRCVDVAALMAAAVLRRNPQALVLPFEHKIVPLTLSPQDSVMSNAQALARIGGGGTDCSAPLAWLNRTQQKVDVVMLISDNESWMDARRSGATETLRQWQEIKRRNPQARLVCLDIQPVASTQALDREDILNIGGFSDQVFSTVSAFAKGQWMPDHWVGEIDKIALYPQ